MNITELSESRKKIFTDKIISSSIYGESIIGKYCCEPFKNSVYTRVFVVGENIDIFGRCRVDGGKNVLGGGVHGLAARDDAVDRQVAQDIGDPFAR